MSKYIIPRINDIFGICGGLIKGGDRMSKGRKRGQSTLEYIIVFAAVVLAVLIIAYTTLKPAVNSVMTASANKITNATATFK